MKKLDFVLIIVLAALYFIFGHISLINIVSNSIVTISPFYSEGFSLAFVLLFGIRVLPGVFLGQFLLAYTANHQILSSLLISFTNSFEAYLGYFILIELLNFDIKLSKLKDVYMLILTIVLVLQPFSALSGTTILYYFSLIDSYHILETLMSWYFGNIMGQLLVTPTILYLYTHYKDINFLKLITITLFFMLLCYFSIETVSIKSISILFSITIIPLVLLLSLKDGLGYALTSVFGIAQVAIYTFQKKTGVFSIYTDIDNIININFYILSHIFIVLVVGVLIIEKNRVLQKYKSISEHLDEKVKNEIDKNREKDKIMFFQSRMAQMGETIALIAHQWRQPLNNLSILNQNIYIKYKKGRLDSDAMEKFFITSKNQIELMSSTIDDFRDFFKPDKQKSEFCLNDTLIHLLDLTKPEFDSYNIYVHRDCKTKLYMVGYKNEFSQAVLNILHNAKDALLANQILHKEITISLDSIDDKIVLTIKDNAGGIDPDIINKIFEPYFSTKSQKSGTGLGLYMSKMIIEEHLGGKISVKNDHKGAVFTIEIPQNTKGGGIFNFPFLDKTPS